jgi:two-component system LytT family response regulator
VLHVIQSNEIYSIEAQDNYVILHTTSGQRMLREPLGALLARLQHPDIVRSHRSHAVNLRYVKTLISMPSGDSEILLTTDQRIPCSRTHREQILNRLETLNG